MTLTRRSALLNAQATHVQTSCVMPEDPCSLSVRLEHPPVEIAGYRIEHGWSSTWEDPGGTHVAGATGAISVFPCVTVTVTAC